MYLKILWIPFAIVYAHSDFYPVEMVHNIGDRMTYLCCMGGHARIVLNFRSMVDFFHQRIDMIFHSHDSRNVKIELIVHDFDNDLLVACESNLTKYHDFILQTASAKVGYETFDEYVLFSPGDKYSFEFSRDEVYLLFWIKVGGNNTILTADETLERHVKKEFNLTLSDHNTRLYCFRFVCTERYDVVLCKRVILKRIKFQLKSNNGTAKWALLVLAPIAVLATAGAVYLRSRRPAFHPPLVPPIPPRSSPERRPYYSIARERMTVFGRRFQLAKIWARHGGSSNETMDAENEYNYIEEESDA